MRRSYVTISSRSRIYSKACHLLNIVAKVARKYKNEIDLELFGSLKETIYDFNPRLRLKSMTAIASLSQTSYAVKPRHGLYSSY